MPRKPTVALQISQELNKTLLELAERAAHREGLSQVQRPQMIERLIKVYKELKDYKETVA